MGGTASGWMHANANLASSDEQAVETQRCCGDQMSGAPLPQEICTHALTLGQATVLRQGPEQGSGGCG